MTRATRRAASSAETPTGADRSGSRRTSCSSRRWSGTTISTGTRSRWSARLARATTSRWPRSRRCSPRGCSRCSCPTPTGTGRRTAASPATRTTRRSGISCSSTSSSTATAARAWEPITRRDGRRWCWRRCATWRSGAGEDAEPRYPLSTRPESTAVGCLLRPVAAERHAAPPPHAASRVIREEQRAGRALTGLHVGKVLPANEPGQLRGNREEKRLGISPAAHGLQLEAVLRPGSGGDPGERLVVLEQTIEGLQIGERLGREGTSHALAYEASEPLSQAPRLIGDAVELRRG